MGGGGRIEVAISDQAGELDCTTRCQSSKTPQSMSIRRGGGWNGWGMVWPIHFIKGILVFFFGRVGFKAQQF